MQKKLLNLLKKKILHLIILLKVAKDEVLEELSDVIFKLQENSMSSVIETTLAKHIIIVSKIYPEFQKTIEDSKDKYI